MTENEPAVFGFSTDQPVSAGRPRKITIPICCLTDAENTGAPRYRNKDVEKLGTVTADIHSIDQGLLKKERGGNGETHYIMDFDVEMRCFAARLEFTPIYLYGLDGQMRFEPAAVKLE